MAAISVNEIADNQASVIRSWLESAVDAVEFRKNFQDHFRVVTVDASGDSDVLHGLLKSRTLERKMHIGLTADEIRSIINRLDVDVKAGNLAVSRMKAEEARRCLTKLLVDLEVLDTQAAASDTTSSCTSTSSPSSSDASMSGIPSGSNIGISTHSASISIHTGSSNCVIPSGDDEKHESQAQASLSDSHSSSTSILSWDDLSKLEISLHQLNTLQAPSQLKARKLFNMMADFDHEIARISNDLKMPNQDSGNLQQLRKTLDRRLDLSLKCLKQWSESELLSSYVFWNSCYSDSGSTSTLSSDDLNKLEIISLKQLNKLDAPLQLKAHKLLDMMLKLDDQVSLISKNSAGVVVQSDEETSLCNRFNLYEKFHSDLLRWKHPVMPVPVVNLEQGIQNLSLLEMNGVASKFFIVKTLF